MSDEKNFLSHDEKALKPLSGGQLFKQEKFCSDGVFLIDFLSEEKFLSGESFLG